jgi:type IV pilus assembly protein PilY1
MKALQRKLAWCGFVAYLSFPAIAYSAPGDLADQPMWLGTSVKHNVMLAIDDSGSMDFEVLFSNNDGAIYLNGNGFFADTNGNLYDSGQKYTYLFPNGKSGSYNGKRIVNNHYAIPPIPAYGFARSAAYNLAYYDPSATYLPWPNFDEYTDDTFIDADVDDTGFEPVATFGAGSMALFADHNTASYTEDGWEFEIQDADMACEDDGSTCSTGDKDYSYYPATYYLKDTSGKYYYFADAGGATSADSVVVEAESGTLLSPMKSAPDSVAELLVLSDTPTTTAAVTAASGNDFIGTAGSLGNASANKPTEGGATIAFDLPAAGTAKIWMRVYAPAGSSDSFWVKLNGYDESDITIDNAGNTWDPADNTWNRFWQGLSSDDTEWEWVLWGTVDLPAGMQSLEVRRREGGTFLDQVFVTTNASIVPSGSMALSTPGSYVERSCATDTSPAHYQDFVRNPSKFKVGDSTSSANIDGLGYDGACLKKFEIARTGADADEAVNGVTGERAVSGDDTRTERNNAEEKQNFANWFHYYRRRHQAMRGGLASAFQGVNGIQTGLFWINNRRTVGVNDVFDMDDDTELGDFLTDHFQTVRSGGTPLRTALEHARSQFTSTTGPITSECQKNYTLLFTDGYNSNSSVSGIGNEDENAGSPYADSVSSTLADVAYKGYNENLRPDLTAGAVRVPAACSSTPLNPALDCNANPHMNTYTVGLGAKGTIFGITHNTVQDAYDNPPVWPDVNVSRDGTQIDDLYHAAVNGRGSMFNAQTPQLLGTALRSALDDIVATIGSGSGVTFNSSSLRADDGTSIYTTQFNSSGWSGDVQARKLNGLSGAVEGLVWKDSNGDPAGAAALLDERDLADKPRTILTSGATDGVGFSWGNLTLDQKNDLKTEPSDTGTPSGTDAKGQARLAFIRGDITDATLRNRSSRLGDIVHSAPVYVGRPASGWPDAGYFGGDAADDSERYSVFKNKKLSEGGAADREPTIYLGGNDGMLHGFNARTSGSEAGQEVFGFIPSSVYSSQSGEGLHYLTDPNYSHRYYVDLSPNVQDVYTPITDGGAPAWRTMLVGGLRGGGKGLFALDVTDPAKFSEGDTSSGSVASAADTVMWEFTSSDDSDLGYTVSSPSIAMMNNGKWAVIFGNGYESTNGKAALFILFVEEGLDGTWAADDYIKIDTGVGSVADKNGLSGVTVVDTTGDYIADRIYAGDLKGNIWAFDVANSVAVKNNGTLNWGIVDSAPLFTARDASGNAQPITAAPGITGNSDQKTTNSNEPNILVTFGTGQYLADGDHSDTSVQSYYTVWDKGTMNLTRADLASRSLVQTGTKMTMTGSDVNWANQEGWFFDFTVNGAEKGERLTSRPFVSSVKDVGPVTIFSSLIPDSSECSGGGTSVFYGLPLLTGLNPTQAILDLDRDGDLDADDFGVGVAIDHIVNQANCLSARCYSTKGISDGTSDSTSTSADLIEDIGKGETADSLRSGRLGWFEMVDE